MLYGKNSKGANNDKKAKEAEYAKALKGKGTKPKPKY